MKILNLFISLHFFSMSSYCCENIFDGNFTQMSVLDESSYKKIATMLVDLRNTLETRKLSKSEIFSLVKNLEHLSDNPNNPTALFQIRSAIKVFKNRHKSSKISHDLVLDFITSITNHKNLKELFKVILSPTITCSNISSSIDLASGIGLGAGAGGGICESSDGRRWLVANLSFNFDTGVGALFSINKSELQIINADPTDHFLRTFDAEINSFSFLAGIRYNLTNRKGLDDLSANRNFRANYCIRGLTLGLGGIHGPAFNYQFNLCPLPSNNNALVDIFLEDFLN